MARAGDGNKYISATATNSPLFTLLGGQYNIAVLATFGGGNIHLQMVLPDGSTLADVGTSTNFTANGQATVQLPAGQYQWTVTTATVLKCVARFVPTD